MEMAFPVYHWTVEKIGVHMIFSFIAYMFLALIYKEIEKRYESVSPILISTIGCLNDINLIYAAKGKRITKKLECKSRTSEVITKGLKPESMIRD
ncbi:MAG: hypothetical protein M1481_03720 [Candidatus Thermoplasmatota archaeon]|nr:hypothetical protein [Candidatus Thermoplasmatota archaeon]MCL5963379.1 hypothetical protein [Candidatus Thermoplasmatota archaeon]